MTTMGVVKNFNEIVVCRVLLGFFEVRSFILIKTCGLQNLINDRPVSSQAPFSSFLHGTRATNCSNAWQYSTPHLLSPAL